MSQEIDVTPTPVLDPAPAPGARLVLVETLYHQSEGADPEAVTSNFSRLLGSDEEPFRRRQRLTQNWQSVELGHITGLCSVVHLIHEPTPRQRTPSPQEIEDDRRVMEVSLRGDGRTDLRVPPGESVRLTGPTVPEDIKICQASGVGRCRVTVIPE